MSRVGVDLESGQLPFGINSHSVYLQLDLGKVQQCHLIAIIYLLTDPHRRNVSPNLNVCMPLN